MKVLVLGGTGFIARRLVDNLLEKKCDITIATSGKNVNPFGDLVTPVILDRFDRLSMEDKLASPPFFDVVFDMLAFRVRDVIPVTEIFKNRIGRYVFVSSAAVYSGDSGTLSEDRFLPEPLAARSELTEKDYAEGKRNVEAYLLANAPFPVAGARFPNVLGHDDSTLRFQDHVNRVRRDETFILPANEGKRNYAWVEDAGRFLAWLGLEGKTGVYNAATPEFVTVRELIESIAGALGRKAQIASSEEESSNSRYYSKRDYIVSVKKAESEGFKFTPMRSWLRKEVEMVNASGEGPLYSAEYRDHLFS